MSAVQVSDKKPLQWERYVTEGHVLMARAREHFRFPKGKVRAAFFLGVAGIVAVSAMPFLFAATGVGSMGRWAEEVRLEHTRAELARLHESQVDIRSRAGSDAIAAYAELTGRYRDPAVLDKLAEAPSEGEMLAYFLDWSTAHRQAGAAPKDWSVATAKALPARLDASTVTEIPTRHGLLALGAAKGADGKPQPFAWLARKGEWSVVLLDEGPGRREALVEALRVHVDANRKDFPDDRVKALATMARGEGNATMYAAKRLGPAMGEILEDVSN